MNKRLNETLLDCVGNSIANYIKGGDKVYVGKVLLNAYNTYQEDERFGVDYIFHIENIDDVNTCIKGGMKYDEAILILLGMTMGMHSGYFYFGENYPKPKVLTNEELAEQLVNCIEEFLPYVMTYTQRGGYKEFYECFVAPIWIEQ